MGRESVNIISMNSARRGMESMAPGAQSSYLQQLIEGAKPDICFLPGDNGKELGSNVVVGFEQYATPSSGNTVLLYDYNKVTMTRPNVNFSTFGHLRGLDVEKLASPMVQIQTLQPVKSVVKEFSMVTWHRDLFSNGHHQTLDLTTLESLVTFAQRFALSTNSSVFMGGEIPLRYEEILSIVKNLSKNANNEFIAQVGNDLKPHGFLPSMTSGSTTSMRHKFKMEVFRCNSNATTSLDSISDCFIASKELQLTEAKMLNVEKVLGRQIQMEALKTHRPVQTEIKYENRPPRHHGG